MAQIAHKLTERPGLQAERTDMSWVRSSLAFFVNGALLLVRGELYVPIPIHITVCSMAFALALFTMIMAHRRRRTLALRPLPQSLAASGSLMLVGAGTALLGGVVLVTLFTG